MKKRIFAAVLALLMLLGVLPALAEDGEPGRDCFSPGVERLENALQNGGIEITASFTPESMLSAKKAGLSVLQALFERASVTYRTNGAQELAQLCWDGGVLADLALVREADAVVLDGSILPFPIAARDESALYYALGMNAGFAQMTAQSAWVTPVHLELPAQSGELTITQAMLDALAQGTDVAGVTLTQPIDVNWTADEEGTLTKAAVTGAVQLAGEDAPWVIDLSAWGGKSKMSVEGTLARDDANRLDLAMSITYESHNATRKQKAGHDANLRVKVSGKLGGYTKSLSVTVKSGNDWAQVEENGVLAEAISQSVSIAYTDKDPAAAKANTAEISVTVKDSGTVQSGGTLEAAQADFETDVLVKIGDYTLLEGTLAASMRELGAQEEILGAHTLHIATAGEATADEAEQTVAWLEDLSAEQLLEVREVMTGRIAELMKTMYPTLPEKTQNIIKDGLE